MYLCIRDLFITCMCTIVVALRTTQFPRRFTRLHTSFRLTFLNARTSLVLLTAQIWTERSHAFLKDIAFEGYFVSFNKWFRNNLSFELFYRTVFIVMVCRVSLKAFQ